ncbi:MAG TPA: hypothetical protein VI548_02080 [Chitinophagaceae bacterium]|nr:hypothetical protein [Chitinophagaceae bacterium]
MKKKTNASIFLALLIPFFLIACNNEKKADEPEATEATTTTAMPVYDPAMDPVNVEAPFLTLHKDTLGIKLYEVALQPGDSVGLHTHPDYVLYVLQGGTARLYSKDGTAQVAELPTGAAIVIPTETHSGINMGTTTIKLLVADIYRPRS